MNIIKTGLNSWVINNKGDLNPGIMFLKQEAGKRHIITSFSTVVEKSQTLYLKQGTDAIAEKTLMVIYNAAAASPLPVNYNQAPFILDVNKSIIISYTSDNNVAIILEGYTE